MNVYLSHNHQKIKRTIAISGSKSESNRLLILQQLVDGLLIENISDSDDTNHLQHALLTKDPRIDIGHAGTAMRFLTAYFSAIKGREVVLTGSERMQNRPIELIVNALNDLGADISYESKIGYPPIRIKGRELKGNNVEIYGNVSSQYISALMLIAPSLPKGLEINLVGEITSVPYIKMTLELLNALKIETQFKENKIVVNPLVGAVEKKVVVESDWSSASYFYSIIALGKIGDEVSLTSYKKESLQGDSCLSEIYQHFGVATSFQEHTILLKKVKEHNSSSLKLDLRNAPDIAQTIAVTCFGLKVHCVLTGLHTLKIKETDRLLALQNELSKLGAKISITKDSLTLEKHTKINSKIAIETYNDHRMAMAFTPLALVQPLTIIDATVVSKSYKNFWNDMQCVGFQIEEV